MPIEIRELIIRATVQEEGEKSKSSKAGGDSKEKIVEAAVSEVFETMKSKKQR
jgi:hypothetical protein